tara:strand:- start:97 stop:792 length:696 start_codon:yes stop_codon:yes gene_type:complete
MKNFIIITIFLFFKNFNLYAELNSHDILQKVDKYLKIHQPNSDYSINKKIKIPSCDGKVAIKKRYESYKTLEIECLGNKPWTYNLRTNIYSKFKIKKKKSASMKKKILAIVSNKGLKRDYILKKEDLKIEYFSQVGSNTTFKNISNLVGRKLKISLKEGQIIRDRHLKINWDIKEGQKVKIEHKKGNLLILVDGVAVTSGMTGDYLEVKNQNSGKVIRGWVKNNKKITIFR